MSIPNLLVQNDSDVTQTLVGTTQDANSVQYRTAYSAVSFNGQTRLTANWETLKNGTWRASVKLELPFLETVGAANAAGYVSQPAVAYVVVAIVTLFAPARSNPADRAHAVRMLSHALIGANSTADSGTSPATGPANQLLDNAVYSPITKLLVYAVPPN